MLYGFGEPEDTPCASDLMSRPRDTERIQYCLAKCMIAVFDFGSLQLLSLEFVIAIGSIARHIGGPMATAL